MIYGDANLPGTTDPSTAAGVVVRLREGKGKPPQELRRSIQLSKTIVETRAKTGTLALRTIPRPSRSLRATTRGKALGAKENLAQLTAVLEARFPSRFDAFVYFDQDDGNNIGLLEIKKAIARLMGDGEQETLGSVDVMQLFRELPLSPSTAKAQPPPSTRLIPYPEPPSSGSTGGHAAQASRHAISTHCEERRVLLRCGGGPCAI